MKEKSIVLSISVLISGRKEMEQCLESLTPFLEELPCELILVDTGCNDEQLSIARRYTDIIIPFTWCNDFSAARNVGLEQAHGEWFMYLDDDEWFANPREMVEFFQCGEYKNYTCARYYQRNYMQRTGVEKQYIDNVVLRMTKLTSETRFHGIIHEFLIPTYPPVKDFDTYVEHYGYIFDNDEDKYKHSKRNVNLLWKQIEMEPTSLRWYSQLAQEYMGVEEYEQVIAICNKAKEVIGVLQQIDNSQKRSIGTMIGFAAKACELKHDFEGALYWIQKGISSEWVYDCAKAYLYQIWVEISLRQENFQQCLNAFLQYVKIYEKKGDNKSLIAMETCLINETVFQEIPRIRTVIRGLLAATKKQEKNILKKYFYTLDWSDKRLFGQDSLEKELLHYACESEADFVIPMIKTFGEREFGILELAPILAEQEQIYQKAEQKEYAWRVQKIASQIESDHHYILGCKILVAEKENDLKKLQTLYDEIFQHSETIFKLRNEIWNIAVKYNIEIEPLFLKTNFGKLRIGIDEWANYAGTEEILVWKKRIVCWKTRTDIRYRYFDMKSDEALLKLKIKENIDFEDLETTLWKHTEIVLAYYHNLYRDEVFLNIPEALPLDTQLAIRLAETREKREQGKVKETIMCLRKCVGLYSALETVVDLYAQKYKDTIEQNDKKIMQEQNELQHLVKTLKGIAKSKIAKGEYVEAKEILQQIDQCMPEDREIVELMEKVENF